MKWSVVDGYENVYRAFVRYHIQENESITKVVNGYSSDGSGEIFQVARYVETIYDVAGIKKLGYRIEVVRFPPSEYVDSEWLDTLFIEGRPIEKVMRSALRHSRRDRGAGIMMRGSSGSSYSGAPSISNDAIQAMLLNLIGGE